MLKSRYLTGILVLLSLTAGSAVASAATKTMPDSSTAQTAQVVQAAAHHNGPHRPFYGYRGGSTIMPGRVQATTLTHGTTVGGIPTPGVPGMATIEPGYVSTRTDVL